MGGGPQHPPLALIFVAALGGKRDGQQHGRSKKQLSQAAQKQQRRRARPLCRSKKKLKHAVQHQGSRRARRLCLLGAVAALSLLWLLPNAALLSYLEPARAWLYLQL